MRRLEFPAGFRWGTATSSFQIEGATDRDGRGPSIWDRFAAEPGRIEDGSDGTTACDHYHRYEEDVRRMAELGLNAYRFSVAWPRVLPSGTGAVNSSGLDFYDRLVDRLLERSIAPFATLYHWDLPQALQDRGGWANRTTAEAFVEYADVVARRLGDRVGSWVTHNEPWCIAALGHEHGQHAPGLKDRRTALAVAHHLFLSHGWTVPLLRERSPGCEVGICALMIPAYAASPSDADAEAARQHDDAVNRWYVEPVLFGRYPEAVLERYRREGVIDDAHPVLRDPSDLDVMSVPTDFLALNYYTRAIVRSSEVPEAENAPRTRFEPADDARTDMGWEVFPQGMYDALVRAHEDWKPPKIYISEFGVAYDDGPDEHGVVRDERRVRYLDAQLRSVHRAIGDGVPVAGVYVWSLLDNFEWSHGYAKRFGLTWVDYETLERTIKLSGEWYGRVAARNGLEEDN